MVGTRRTQQLSAMERDRLELMTVEELQREATRYQLPVTTDRGILIGTILSHVSLNSPMDEAVPATSAVRASNARVRKGSGGSQGDRRGSVPSVVVTPSADAPAQTGALDRLADTLTTFMQQQQIQQQQMLEEIRSLSRRDNPVASDPPLYQDEVEPVRSPAVSIASPAQAVTLLAPQIPEFGGTDEENVHIWSQRVDRVAQVHRASEDVVLLAVSSKLTKLAKQWYEMQSGHVLESWYELKQALIKMFDRRISFTAAMQKIEARRWSPAKESFDQYSIDKLALIHRLDLPSTDTINLIIGGIPQHSLRATALALPAQSVDRFLETMRRITHGMGEHFDKKTNHPNRNNKKNEGKPQSPKDKSTKGTCHYCKKEGHWKSDCPLLKKKERTVATASSSSPAPASSSTQPTAAAVEGTTKDKFYLSGPLFEINSINNFVCNLYALMDTGSPVSFISLNNYKTYLNCSQSNLETVDRKFNALPKTPINVVGKINSVIKFEAFPDRDFEVCLHVVDSDFSEMDLIIGRDFLEKYELTLVFRPAKSTSDTFTQLLLQTDICYTEINTESILDETEIDFGLAEKRQLKETVLDCENSQIDVVDDDYCVSINLKDHTTYAYAPRKFALEERKQIHAITDDLLTRGVIKTSTSPYCARIVPVRKKNGNLRLCVDLRPLNARILKQKYPFPLIEDCLAQLSDRSVFTLLDLKDGFHQIKVNPQHTKYFSFATPDGQFEYVRLPFGFSEAPVEFQKRIVQVLQPLIRQDKVIVYIDDILIATSSVKQNLEVLKEVLLTLKKYGFELNFAKCCFLKKQIEFLGYIISKNRLTMSDRHTDSVKKFPVPRNIHQLQRFLGLANYFRKFIQNYALKAKPLHNLLRKSAEYNFDAECISAFETLKAELTAYPVLRLYRPTAPTELHTDASAQGLGAILLQKQSDANWAPVAYFSQTTNSAESRYHSFELEMLAIVRAVERFHIYLYGIKFTVITDCNALVYAVNKANLNPRIARWTLSLQNYDFKVEHRPGKRMAHVDALSRQIFFLEILPLERELEFKQLQDPRIKEIAHNLEFNEDNKFQLIDGLVYRKSEDRARFVVPDAMIQNILRIYHDNMSHCGFEKTYQGVHGSYWFPAMRKKIRDHIDNCITCLYANSSTNRFEGESQIDNYSPTKPFEIIHIDHFGPLQETPNGSKYVFVIVDAFTRYTWFFPTKTTNAKEVQNYLKLVFHIFGTPGMLVTDRGSAFTSKEFSNFLEKLNLNARKVAVASPWANGAVERVNRYLKSSLAKSIDSPDNWEDRLDAVQYTVNNTNNSAIKTSPSKLLLGYEQQRHDDKNLKDYLECLLEIDNNISEQRERARDIAAQANNKLRDYNKAYYDRTHKKPTIYKEGDLVLIRDLQAKIGTSKKLKPNYKGPYMITKVLNKNRYVVKDIPGFNITQKPYDTILSSDKLKHWIKPVINTNVL